MKMPELAIPCLLSILLLGGCKSADEKTMADDGDEFVLPKMQQNTYLAHSKMPQYFGFEAYAVRGGLDFRGHARMHPNHMATVDFEKGKIPVIEVRGRSPRMKLKLLLDTSSPTSWMEFKASQEFEATFLGVDDQSIPYRGGYNTGGVEAYAAVVRQIRIDQLFMENVPLYVRMAMNSLGPLERGIQKPKVEAVFGWDNLVHFEYIQFDFREEAVHFSASIPYIPHQDLLMTEAKMVGLRGYGLAVEGAIFGEPTPIILDVAGDYHFIRSDVKVSKTKQVSIGDVVYRKVPTMLYPVDPTRTANPPPRAGRLMLENYLITICPKQGVVYFERFPE
ncbi:hypothetical protein PDESU_04507 [Pontiella desulfatans]|uniref:Peptidase A2 domain-containing protein n=1 Tax=Pontiella desulfatans TaxID=2750659 RepID=A0A6C2U765_PONDE|nr:hypothetical protein [Pontiella desulfatans]VGO15918.1 hypothetical protein PDESU_04507 [Pontiella desulfatans]